MPAIEEGDITFIKKSRKKPSKRKNITVGWQDFKD